SFAKLNPASVEKNTVDALPATATRTELANASQKLNWEAESTSPKFSMSVRVGNQVGRVPTARETSRLVDEPCVAEAYNGKTETTKTSVRSAYVTRPGLRVDGLWARTGMPLAALFCAYLTAPRPAVFSMNPVLIGSLLPWTRPGQPL